MTKHEIIGKLAQDKELIRIARSITKGDELYKDLFQEALIYMLGISDERFSNILKPREYCIKIMLRQYHLPRTVFYNIHRHKDECQDMENIEIPNVEDPAIDINSRDIELSNEYFDNLTPESVKIARTLHRLKCEDNSNGKYEYRTELFKLWLAHGSTRKVEKYTGINYRSVAFTIAEVKKEIKKGD